MAKKIVATEEQEQIALAMYLDTIIGQPGWCHVPNGGMRHKRTAGILKAQGVKRGVPDVLIFKQTPKMKKAGFVGLAIELKRTNMSPSDLKPDQKEWLSYLSLSGWVCYVAKGAGDAIEFLKKWGF